MRLLSLLAVATCFALAAHAAPPATRTQPVTDSYHGVRVSEDYRWLEDSSAPEVKAWSAAQNAEVRKQIDALPVRKAIAQRLEALFGKVSANYGALVTRPDKLFALKFAPPKQQPFLVVLNSGADPKSERIVFDPNAQGTKGSVVIDWFVPSPDGQTVAICLSEGGSEAGTLYFHDVATGRPVAERLERVQFPTGGGSVAWNARGTGVFYTRYPAAGERPAEDERFFQQVYFHSLGRPQRDDARILGEGLPRIAEIALEGSEVGSRVIATVQNGDGGEFEHYLLKEDGTASRITDYADKVRAVKAGRDGRFYLLSRLGAPQGRILRIEPEALATGKPDLSNARVVVPESEGAIEDFLPLATCVFVSDMVGGPSQLRVFELDGQARPAPPAPEIATLSDLVSIDGQADAIFFRQATYTEPSAWFRYDANADEAKRLTATALKVVSPVSFAGIEVTREYAVSKDGTKVPINILKKKGIPLDGTNPTILSGYGGYGISMTPGFVFNRHIWLDNGGVYAIANLRGGGEYGEDWHLAGNLTKKQAVFDDFLAAARHLIERKYTAPSRLAIEGGSNGGLLMGAALTQAPELFRAVVSHVGIYDMLRVELDSNGAFNVTEFGSVKDKAQFEALSAYSPYHRVKDGVKYPAVFLLTGENDGRVAPYHSRKMAARLQAATASGLPVLLRIDSASGHGIGTALSARIAEQAGVFAFLFDQLGLKYRAPEQPAGPTPSKKK